MFENDGGGTISVGGTMAVQQSKAVNKTEKSIDVGVNYLHGKQWPCICTVCMTINAKWQSM
jgi:hypothetical protein